MVHYSVYEGSRDLRIQSQMPLVVGPGAEDEAADSRYAIREAGGGGDPSIHRFRTRRLDRVHARHDEDRGRYCFAR